MYMCTYIPAGALFTSAAAVPGIRHRGGRISKKNSL